eukprot:TRINITY_DN1964_c0_g1_i1.p1 TRINITY_DN1964_c0_g1~~TRINITY_DN1964_c0_g1_i1.p1  ORF type:complete len:456 (-),score=61.25 TRINITY_DN1964_c0_g1_i1:192-1559(-)
MEWKQLGLVAFVFVSGIISLFLQICSVLLAPSLGDGMIGSMRSSCVCLITGTFAGWLTVPFTGSPTCAEVKENLKKDTSKWWFWLGGIFAVIYVLALVLLTPYVGLALCAVCTNIGQLASAMLWDALGDRIFVVHTSQPITKSKIIGLIATITGVVVMQDWGGADYSVGMGILSIVLCFAAGFGLPFQALMNRSLSVLVVKSTFIAMAISFTGGGLLSIIIYAVTTTWQPFTISNPGFQYWLGGVTSVYNVVVVIALPPLVGFNVYYVLFITGQLAGSLLFDSLGAFGDEIPITWLRILGAVISIFGCIVIQLYNPPANSRSAIKPASITPSGIFPEPSRLSSISPTPNNEIELASLGGANNDPSICLTVLPSSSPSPPLAPAPAPSSSSIISISATVSPPSSISSSTSMSTVSIPVCTAKERLPVLLPESTSSLSASKSADTANGVLRPPRAVW